MSLDIAQKDTEISAKQLAEIVKILAQMKKINTYAIKRSTNHVCLLNKDMDYFNCMYNKGFMNLRISEQDFSDDTEGYSMLKASVTISQAYSKAVEGFRKVILQHGD